MTVNWSGIVDSLASTTGRNITTIVTLMIERNRKTKKCTNNKSKLLLFLNDGSLSMVKISKPMEKILDVSEEKDDDIIKELKENSEEGDVFLSIIAPYVGVQITPSKLKTASVGVSEEFGIETVIEQIKEKCIETNTETKTLYLLINSPGGVVSSSYKVARALRKNFKNIVVFVPHIAASGGTLIAIIGNKIVMGMMSQLTPLDPHDGHGTSALSVRRGFDSLTEIFKKVSEEDAPYTYKVMAEKYEAQEYDYCLAILEMMEQYIAEILKDAGYSEEATRKISKRLVEGFLVHEEVINLDRAKKLGLNAVEYTEYKKLWETLRQHLGNYLLKSADKHIIRYWIHTKPNSETSGETP